jgi:hypothetical protein
MAKAASTGRLPTHRVEGSTIDGGDYDDHCAEDGCESNQRSSDDPEHLEIMHAVDAAQPRSGSVIR